MEDGSIGSAMMTWEITDAQMAALGLTDQSKINAFAQKLVDDVMASLVQRASRGTLDQLGTFWEVRSVLRTTARPGTVPGTGTVPARDVPRETSYWPLAGGIGLIVAGVYFLGKK
jgi:hypothetical protein